jgi:hypothetical protein
MDFLKKTPEIKNTPANTTDETKPSKSFKATKYLVKVFVSNCDSNGNWPENTTRVHGYLTTITSGTSLFINPPTGEKGESIHLSDMKECQEYMAENKVPIEFKWIERIVDKVKHYIFDNRPSKSLFLEFYEKEALAALKEDPNYQVYMDDRSYIWYLALKVDGTWAVEPMNGSTPKLSKKGEQVFVAAPEETTFSDITKSPYYIRPVLMVGDYKLPASQCRKLEKQAAKDARNAEQAAKDARNAEKAAAANPDDYGETEEEIVMNSAEPAVKPAAEPAAKPAAEPAVKPAAEPAVKPAVAPTAKPAGNTGMAYAAVAGGAKPAAVAGATKPAAVAEQPKAVAGKPAAAASEPVMTDIRQLLQKMCENFDKLATAIIGQKTTQVPADVPPPLAATAVPAPLAAAFVAFTADGKRIAPVAFTTATKCTYKFKCHMKCGFSHINDNFEVAAGDIIPDSVCPREFALVEHEDFDVGRCTDPSCTAPDHANDRRGTVIPTTKMRHLSSESIVRTLGSSATTTPTTA